MDTFFPLSVEKSRHHPPPLSLSVEKDRTNEARSNLRTSDIDIDFHKNEYVHFRPLLYYLNTKDPYHSSVYNDPPSADNLTETECAGFRIPGVLPSKALLPLACKFLRKIVLNSRILSFSPAAKRAVPRVGSRLRTRRHARPRDSGADCRR